MKLNITPGPWAVSKHPDTNNVHYVDGLGCTQGRTATCYTGERPDDATAIVTAVNNTYHKGINPEAVPDMLEFLQSLYKWNILNAETQNDLSDLLQKATL